MSYSDPFQQESGSNDKEDKGFVPYNSGSQTHMAISLNRKLGVMTKSTGICSILQWFTESCDKRRQGFVPFTDSHNNICWQETGSHGRGLGFAPYNSGLLTCVATSLSRKLGLMTEDRDLFHLPTHMTISWQETGSHDTKRTRICCVQQWFTDSHGNFSELETGSGGIVLHKLHYLQGSQLQQLLSRVDDPNL